MRGWMSSNSTERQRDRAFRALADARDEVAAHGHDAQVALGAEASYYVAPSAGAALSTLDDGVAEALRRHMAAQGLTSLADTVDELEALGRRLRRRDDADHSVSAVVYQMH